MVDRTPRRRPPALLRVVAAIAVVGAAVLAPARPVAADPARPTDYRSRILTIRPALPPGVGLRVVGGDAFLELDVDRGHTVTVPDYQQGARTTPPPYLQVQPDGTVRVNERSIAATINDSRFGGDSSAARPDGPPRWSEVGRDGRYSWHDHRIHWMSPVAPAVGADRRVDMGGEGGTWTVELDVDGRATTVVGELLLDPAPSPAPWVAVAILAGAVVVAGALIPARRGRAVPHRAVAGALAAAGVLATVIGTAQWQATPAGAGGSSVSALLPALATVSALAAALLGRSRGQARLVCLAAAAAALAGWAIVRRAVLFRAVLPTSLPFTLDRLGTALAIGVALGAAAVLVSRPPPTQPRRRPPPA